MLFKSQVLTQASGSVGGLTYSHNRFGMYTRARTVPVNPNSSRQQAMRMYLDSVVTYWTETLTEAERESWRVYAANVPVVNKLGDTVNLTGQQQFIRSGVPWLLAGKDLADIATAPTTFDTGDPGNLTFTIITAATNVAIITVTGAPAWAADDDAGLLAFFGNPQNPSVSFYKSPFRFGGFVPGDSGTPVVTAQFDSDNCDPAIDFTAGQKCFIRVRALLSDGRLTQAFVFDSVAV